METKKHSAQILSKLEEKTTTFHLMYSLKRVLSCWKKHKKITHIHSQASHTVCMIKFVSLCVCVCRGGGEESRSYHITTARPPQNMHKLEVDDYVFGL